MDDVTIAEGNDTLFGGGGNTACTVNGLRAIDADLLATVCFFNCVVLIAGDDRLGLMGSAFVGVCCCTEDVLTLPRALKLLVRSNGTRLGFGLAIMGGTAVCDICALLALVDGFGDEDLIDC